MYVSSAAEHDGDASAVVVLHFAVPGWQRVTQTLKSEQEVLTQDGTCT